MVENIVRGPVICVDEKNTIILNKNDFSNLNYAKNIVFINLLQKNNLYSNL